MRQAALLFTFMFLTGACADNTAHEDVQKENLAVFHEAKQEFDHGNYNKSLQLYLRFITDSEHDSQAVGDLYLRALCNTGAIHFYFNDYLGALEYFTQGYKKSRTLKHAEMQKIFTNNRCLCLIKLGRTKEAENEVSKNSTATNPELRLDMMHLNYLKGSIAMRKRNWNEAAWHLKQTLNSHRLLHNDKKIEETYKDLGECYEALGQWKTALHYTQKAEEISKRVNNVWIQEKCLRSLMNIYAHLGGAEKMLSCQDRYFRLSDSLMNSREYMLIRSTYEQFEKNEKGREIKNLSSTVLWQKNLFMAGALLLVLIVCALLWQHRQKQKLYLAYRAVFDRNRDLLDMEKQYRQELAKQGGIAQHEIEKHQRQTVQTLDDEDEDLKTEIEDFEDLFNRIIYVMENTQEYCNPAFGLPQLTALVGSNTTYVSKAIRTKVNKNVRTFINEYRAKHVAEWQILPTLATTRFKPLARAWVMKFRRHSTVRLKTSRVSHPLFTKK